jgi:ATP-dependent Lon protease
MFPEILKDVGFAKDEVVISDENIIDLIETYTNEAGVRKLKEKLFEIVREINLKNIFNNNIRRTISQKISITSFLEHASARRIVIIVWCSDIRPQLDSFG